MSDFAVEDKRTRKQNHILQAHIDNIGKIIKSSYCMLALGNSNYCNKRHVIFIIIKGTVIINTIISEKLFWNQTWESSNSHLLSS